MLMGKCVSIVSNVLTRSTVHSVISLEEADSSGASSGKVVIANEGNATITNQQRPLEGLCVLTMFYGDVGKEVSADKRHELLKNECDEEGYATIFNECCNFLQNKSDEGSA